MREATALITGGAGNIGRETARVLIQRGFYVVLVDKDAKTANTFIAEINATASCATFLEADLLDPACFDSVARQVEERFGRLDALVNNAAFYDDSPGWGVPFESEGYEAWQKVMQVNLLAPFFLAQRLTPLLRKSSCASIVNVSSIYGVVGPDHRLYEGLEMTNPAAYSASKGGLLQLTRWLSTVLAPQIRVNSVTPGGVARGQDPVFVERYCKRTPLKRMATEKDVAGSIAFLLSEDAKYMTGQNLVVDGGWTSW